VMSGTPASARLTGVPDITLDASLA
jgi:hypothetical protein